MSVVERPTSSASLAGGAIESEQRPCSHGPARHVEGWSGEPGTAGTVAVVGAGKMGLPLAAQFATHGWHVIAVDIDETIVAAINEGGADVEGELGLVERVREAHALGQLRATTDARAAAAVADVTVLIVPVMLDARN